MHHEKTNIVQTDDYYPFGLAFNSYTRTASTPQNFTFNGYEEQPEIGTLFSEFRMYDQTIGRFWAQDPIEKENISPYAFALNNPILYMDYLGLDTVKYDPNRPVSTGDVQELPEFTVMAEREEFKEFNTKITNEEAGIEDNPSHVAQAAPIALTLTVADGPIPIGDAIAVILMSGALVWDLTEMTTVKPPIQLIEGDASKSEKHGDSGRAKTKAEKQIEDLELSKEGKSKKERQRINRKIENIRKAAQKKGKGEEHSRTRKR